MDDSFDYDKREDASFTGVMGRIMLDQQVDGGARASMQSGSEAYIELTKYGILHDMVLKLNMTVTSTINAGLTKDNKAGADVDNYKSTDLHLASGISVYDFIDKIEVRTRSGYILYEIEPWTYMDIFRGCKFDRYRKLALSNIEKRKVSSNDSVQYTKFKEDYDPDVFDKTVVNPPPKVATKSFTFAIPIYLEWFRKLAKCPDMLSLEDCHLVVKMKNKSDIQKLFVRHQLMPLKDQDVTKAGTETFDVTYNAGTSLRQYYVQPPQDRYNAILQSKHEGGLPFNMLTVNHFKEQVAAYPFPTAHAVDNALSSVTLKCQFPVYRTFVRLVYVPDATALSQKSDQVKGNQRELLRVKSFKVTEAGQTFYESQYTVGLLGDGEMTDNILMYDQGDTDQHDTSYDDKENSLIVNWSMMGLLPDSGESRSALSFYQMTNPKLEITFDKPLNYTGSITTEIVHEYISVFATQASANMRNRSIRRLATK